MTEGTKKDGPAVPGPNSKPDYAAVFASEFYDLIVAGYRKQQVVGPFLSSPVVVDNMI